MTLSSKLIYFGVLFFYGALYGGITGLDSILEYTFLIISSILMSLLQLSMEN